MDQQAAPAPAPSTQAPAGPTPEAQRIEGDGEALTPAERAYFESRGTKGFDDGSGAAPAPYPAETTDDAGTDDGSDGDMDDAEIIIDDAGMARDAKTKQFVPKPAYLRTKNENKSLKSQLSHVATELIRQRERTAILTEVVGMQEGAARQPAAPAPEPEPIRPEDDFIGAYDQMATQLKSLKEELRQARQETTSQFEARHMQETVRTDMQRYSQAEPAFLEAYQHLVTQRDAELQAMGQADPRAREQAIINDLRNIMTSAIKAKRSGAETLFALAKARGFAPKAPAQTPAAAIDPKAAASIEAINRGKAASASLSGAGTAGGVGQPLTAVRLAEMGEDEFHATRTGYIGKHGREAWNRLVGGG